MSSGFFLQDRVRTGSRPGSHPQQAAATPALRCPALCQGCWKWQQLLCQGSCTLLSRCCALYATSPGLQCPAPCRAVGAEHGHPVSPDTKGLRGPSNTVVLKGTSAGLEPEGNLSCIRRPSTAVFSFSGTKDQMYYLMFPNSLYKRVFCYSSLFGL